MRSRLVPGLILALALGLRLAYARHEPITAAVRPDSASFTTIAHNLVTLHEFAMHPPELTAYRPPGYPLFLAALQVLAGPSVRVILIAQALLGTAVVGGIMLLARRLSPDPRVAWIAGTIAAAYPFFIYYDGSVLAESLLTFSTTLAIVTYMWWKEKPASASRGLLCVVSWVYLSLIKTIFAPVFLLCLAHEFYHRTTRRWWIVIALILFEIPSAVWGLRNQHLFGRKLIDSHGGQTCFECIVYYEVNKKGTFAESFKGNPIEQQALTMNEADRDAFYFAKVKRFILENPGRYLRQCLMNFKDFWRFYPRQDLSFVEGSRKVTIISLITEPFLILAGMWGAWKARRRWQEWIPAILCVLALTAIHSATCAQMRYRLPLMPIIIVFASYAVAVRTKRS